ncbi:MAG TPA: WS/DGAT domain-containing protein, partial [Actinopolymorphaceae bacterium]|nr:WS/DGAT domain-containing protein [Actinopolymorphaceae bacterium]
HRGLAVPTAAWVSDFAPHPFWVYADVDRTYVVHEAALAAARLADPAARVSVSALPVQKAFHPGHSAAARQRFGLRPEAFVVLVSCGTFAFGVSESMVRSVLAADKRVQLVAACGHNAVALRRLEDLGLDHDRLLPLGWIDDMPALNQAADVVVTNAGGATALEAVASGRPVFMVDPIPAHGAANASLMAVAGLAEMCASQAHLATRLRGVLADRDRTAAGPRPTTTLALPHRDILADLEAVLRPVRPARTDEPVPDHAPAHPPADPDGSAMGGSSAPWPMRPVDAFFAHVDEGGPSQEIGVILDLDPLPSGAAVDVDTLRAIVAERIGHLPPLRWQPMRRGHRFGWALRNDLDVDTHIDERVATSHAELDKTVDAFWSERMRYDRPPWQMLLVRRSDDAKARLLVKAHHCLGDGLSGLGLLDWLLDPVETGAPAEPGPSVAGTSARARRRRPAPGVAAAARGLWRLAVHGRAPRHPLNATPMDMDRTVILITLPAARLRSAARGRGMRTYELALGVVAETLDRLLRPAGQLAEGMPLRAVLPLSAARPGDDQITGNWTSALPVDLAMGPMSPQERLTRLRAALRQGAASGAPLAAGLVMRVAGLLPARAHAWFARHSYSGKFLNLVVSYVPGPRGSRSLAGAPVRAMYPVAPLTRQVPLSIGMITTDTTAGVGILADRGLELDPDVVRTTMRGAFLDLVES